MAQNSVSKTTVITTFQSLDEEMEPQNQPKDYLRTSGFLGGPTSTEKKEKIEDFAGENSSRSHLTENGPDETTYKIFNKRVYQELVMVDVFVGLWNETFCIPRVFEAIRYFFNHVNKNLTK